MVRKREDWKKEWIGAMGGLGKGLPTGLTIVS